MESNDHSNGLASPSLEGIETAFVCLFELDLSPQTFDSRLNRLSEAVNLFCQWPEDGEEVEAWCEDIFKDPPEHAAATDLSCLVALVRGIRKFRAEDLAKAEGHFNQARKGAVAAFKENPEAASILAAVIRNWQASIAMARFQLPAAGELLVEAADLLKNAGQIKLCPAWIHLLRGKLSCITGQFAEAEEAFDQADALLRSLWYERSYTHAECHTCHARLHLLQGNWAEGRREVDRSEAIRESIGDEIGRAKAYFYRGRLYRAEREFNEAIAQLTTALGMAESRGFRSLAAAVSHILGDVLMESGRPKLRSRAQKHFEQALELSREIGDQRGVYASCYALLKAERAEAVDRLKEDDERRMEVLQLLLDRCTAMRSDPGVSERRIAKLWHLTAALRRDVRAIPTAIDAFGEALDRFEKFGMVPEIIEVTRELAELCASEGKFQRAARLFVRALDLTRKVPGSLERVNRSIRTWISDLPPEVFCQRLAELEERAAATEKARISSRREFQEKIKLLNRQKRALWLAIAHPLGKIPEDEKTLRERFEEARACLDHPEMVEPLFEDTGFELSASGACTIPVSGVVEALRKSEGGRLAEIDVEDGQKTERQIRVDLTALELAVGSCRRILEALSAGGENLVIGRFRPDDDATELILEAAGRTVKPATMMALMNCEETNAKPANVGLADRHWVDLGQIEPFVEVAGGSVSFESEGDADDPSSEGVNRFRLHFQ